MKIKRHQSLKLRAIGTNLLISYKALPFFLGLVVSYSFIEESVTPMFMEYIQNNSKANTLPKAAIITNLQDGVSCIAAVIISLISEAYTRRFTMVTFCSSVTTMGLMLLWISAATNEGYDYVAIILLTLGRTGGGTGLEHFIHYQLDQKVRERKTITNEEDKKNQKAAYIVTVVLWNLGVLFFAYTTNIVFSVVIFSEPKQNFRFAALLMGGSYMFFYLGYPWYIQEKLPRSESSLGKVYRICRTAYRNRKLGYPTSVDRYHWKNYKQSHVYKSTTKDHEVVRLFPRVPFLFRWLDKAAIVVENREQFASAASNHSFTVKEVREVKTLALLLCWGFTLVGYSLVVASAETFFVEQANSLDFGFSGSAVTLVFVLRSVTRDIVVPFFCWLIGIAFRRMGKYRIRRIYGRTIRIGIGMVCALSCVIVAWQVEARRMNTMLGGISYAAFSKPAIVSQFLLLGLAEGLTEDKLEDLFDGCVYESMRNFDESFSQLVIGSGKLLTIPCVLIFRGWFKKTYEVSHLDKYYRMLAVMNSFFLLDFGFYYYWYVHTNKFPEDDEEIMTESRNSEEKNLAAKGDSYPEHNEEIVHV